MCVLRSGKRIFYAERKIIKVLGVKLLSQNKIRFNYAYFVRKKGGTIWAKKFQYLKTRILVRLEPL